MVLHALDVVFDHRLVDAKKLKEIGQQLVSARYVPGECLARGGEDEPSIFFVFEQAVYVESLHHVRDACLRDPKACRDVDDAGVTLGIDQLENPLKVILHRGGAARGVGFRGHADKRDWTALQSTKYFVVDKSIESHN